MNKEFLLAMQEALTELLTEAETSGGCNCTDNSCCGSQPDECDDSESISTPIEDCITAFINKCTAEGRLPTLEEAQSIYTLDQINSKYN